MPFRRLYRAVHIRRRNRVLRAADAVSTVSPWHVDFIRQFNPDTQLVYNGFAPKQFYPEDVPSDCFCVTYIGSLFDWQQPALTTVKDVLGSLPSDIRLEIHTPQHDAITHNRLGDAIRRSSIMLVFTHPGTHGMLTTKFYEALGCEKPILCVPSDQGALAELIAYTNTGIATDDKDAIRAFIKEKYHEWQQNGFTRQAVQHREQFSRETQSAHMETIINRLTP
jgi:hypothetical protein